MFKGFNILAGLMVSLILLTGCQTPPQTRALMLEPPPIAKQHFIEQVPFYPQQQYYCGPTTLAEVANYHGLPFSPTDIAPLSFVPGLAGSLQIEMVAATRQLGMLAYEQQGSMTLLLSLLAEDIPVIVLQNNSIALLPQWHYAVAIGYDISAQELILHSGVTKNHRLNFATFERTWQRGNYWMLAMLPTHKTSVLLNPFIYVKACQDLLDTQQSEAGIAAMQSAVKQWPEYWLGYFLLANHYLDTQPERAVDWYSQGYQYAKNELSYLNNYAYALGQIQCYAEAKALITQALSLAPTDANVLDTQQQLILASHKQGQQNCRLFDLQK